LSGPKIGFLDIETSPIIAYVWSRWKQNIAINQIAADWHVMSWAFKWKGSSEIIYMDQRNAKRIEDDKKILKPLHALIDDADIIVAHNGDEFDLKKLNARFILNGLKPPSPYKTFDTMKVARQKFGFTACSLEYLVDKLCHLKKDKHARFQGQDLWTECLKGNPDAWDEMEKYNKQDVKVLEPLYERLSPWDQRINHSLYTHGAEHVCSCGSRDFQSRGYAYTAQGKFHVYYCKRCGAWTRGRENLRDKEQKKNTRIGAP
jgi:hypothetical protein